LGEEQDVHAIWRGVDLKTLSQDTFYEFTLL